MSLVLTPFVVGIAGGSGSGKTTLARGLADALGRDRVAIVAHDAYYRDRRDADPAAADSIDFDVPEALDQSCFVADLHRLRAGEPVHPPEYCFATHRRLGPGSPVTPREIVIVEGILLFHDPDVRAALDLRIFVDAPAELRRERRIGRDVRERGRTPESVVRQLAATVWPAHRIYVEPSRAHADLVLLNAGAPRALVEIAAELIRERLLHREHAAGLAARAAQGAKKF